MSENTDTNTGTNNFFKRYLDYKGLDVLWKLIVKKFVTIDDGTLNNPTISGAKSISIKYPNSDANSESYDVWHKGNLRRTILHDNVSSNNYEVTLTPNCYDLILEEVPKLHVTYENTDNNVHEYNLEFTIGNTQNNVIGSNEIVFPSNMNWVYNSNGTNTPIWLNDTSYQINILHDIASYKMFTKPDDDKRIYYSLFELPFSNASESNYNRLLLPASANTFAKGENDTVIDFNTEACEYNIGNTSGKKGVIVFTDKIYSITANAFNAIDNKYDIGENLINNTTNINGKDYGKEYKQFENIKSIILPNTVTTIGNDAFKNSTALETIYIPNSVSEVGVDAFYGCNELLEFDRGNETNEDSKYLLIVNNTVVACAPKGIEENGGEVTIPDGVTAISKNAFKNCTTVKSVKIPDSLTMIGYGAFQGCSNLESVNIPINNVTIIDGWAFQGCSKLQSAPIGNSVTTIGTYAFSGCTIISNITIPDSVTTIGTYAFNNCSNLTSITFNTKTNSIDIKSSAFSRCSKLTNVTFTKNVDLTKFNTTSLSSITNITDIHIDCDIKKSVIDANTNKNTLCGLKLGNATLHIGENASFTVTGTRYTNSIDQGAFNGCNINEVILYHISYISLYIRSAFSNCSGDTLDIRCNIPNASYSNDALFYNSKFETLKIGNDVTTIGNDAFENCTNFTSITIPDSITTIGNDAFRGCSGLISVTIGSGVTTIGDSAFRGCSSLTDVTIPDGITTIGDSAFYNCNKLANVIFNRLLNNDNTITIGNDAFYGCSSIESVRTLTWSLKIWCEKFIFTNNKSNPLSNGNAYLYLGSGEVYPLRDLSIWTSSDSETRVLKINDYAFYDYRGFSETYNGSYPTFSVGFVTTASNFKTGEIPNSNKNEVIEIGTRAFYGSMFSTVICRWARNNADRTYRDNSIEYWLSRIKFKDEYSGLFSSITELHFNNTYDSGNPWYDPYNTVISTSGTNNRVRTQKLVTLDLSSVRVNPKIQDYNLCNYKYLANIIISDKSTNKGGSEQTMQNNLTIGVGAFKGCSGLKKIVAYAGSDSGGWTTLRKNGFINWCSTVFEDDNSNPLMALSGTSTNHVGFYNTRLSDDEITSINFSENDSLRTINARAFINGKGITSITIPSKVTSIGDKAFTNCNLNTITCYVTTPPTIATNTFNLNTNLSSIKVPSSSVSTYKAATNWSAFASKISSM